MGCCGDDKGNGRCVTTELSMQHAMYYIKVSIESIQHTIICSFHESLVYVLCAKYIGGIGLEVRKLLAYLLLINHIVRCAL